MIALTRRIALPEGSTYHAVVRPLEVFAAAILAVTTAPFAAAQFSKKVPMAIPSVQDWERITGDQTFESPRVAVQYEFYVNPARPAAYEVVRYRVTDLGPVRQGKSRYPTTEKLQWDRDGRDVRRFECVENAAGGAGCAWEEMERAAPTTCARCRCCCGSTARTAG